MTLTIAAPAGFRLERVARSHGWYDLPPFAWDGTRLSTVAHVGGAAHDVAIEARDGALAVTTSARDRKAVGAMVASMLQLDEDLAPLYALTDGDTRLDYARAHGVGRMLRAPTAYEDVIKMLLTTNCSWSLTRVMVSRLVEALGEPAPSGARAFPTAAAMAGKREKFYRDVVRAGYRAPHLAKIARDVASARIDPEAWRATERGAVDDENLRSQLLALPGIGPYAADNLMRLCGHYGYLGLDSWCRGKLKRLYPRIRDVDAFAQRRYKPFGQFAGLAMWLDLTRDWHESETKDFG